MPAKAKFNEDVSLSGASYLIHAQTALGGSRPRIVDLSVFVYAKQENNSKKPLTDPTKLAKPGTLTLYWADDNKPTHVFNGIHLRQTLTGLRTMQERVVLLEFGYEYKEQVPGWLKDNKT